MPAKMDEYCKTNGFAGWFETSAKDNVNIEESAKALVSKVRPTVLSRPDDVTLALSLFCPTDTDER